MFHLETFVGRNNWSELKQPGDYFFIEAGDLIPSANKVSYYNSRIEYFIYWDFMPDRRVVVHVERYNRYKKSKYPYHMLREIGDEVTMTMGDIGVSIESFRSSVNVFKKRHNMQISIKVDRKNRTVTMKLTGKEVYL